MGSIPPRRSAVPAVALVFMLGCLLGRPALGIPVPQNVASSAEFTFSTPATTTWRVSRPGSARLAVTTDRWLKAASARDGRQVEFSDRLMLALRASTPPNPETLARLGVRVDRAVNGFLILQATDAWSALVAADALARDPSVRIATPISRRPLALHGRWGPAPTDAYFPDQWHLQNRDASGQPLGPDLNPRGAWAFTRAAGVRVAICDDGFEVAHPDLRPAAEGQPHFDFINGTQAAATYGDHATCVAGLAGARGFNSLGVTGTAPEVSLVSLAIFDRFGGIADDEKLADMFEYRIGDIHIQNHSWGNADTNQLAPTPLEFAAISNAVTFGRGGLGTVMVRSAGNDRILDFDVNDDGYANDPQVIAVAAIRKDGRVTSYSNRGACILVGAPSGDDSDATPTPAVCTTDRVGSRGYNPGPIQGDRADYAFPEDGFAGTSASAPEISGLTALVLGINPGLGYRDVQQVLLESARHRDLADPAVVTNGAGYRVSHNVGFGMPDASQAVQLARAWSNRPPLQIATARHTGTLAIPDDGLKLRIARAGGAERALRTMPAQGLHADAPTGRLPLVFVGQATNPITANLRGRAALIERGTNFFREKIRFAAEAGAAFAVIYNHINGDEVIMPGGTEFEAIPAVFISENEGRQLVRDLASGPVEAQIRLDSATVSLEIPDTLSCEHVGLRVRAVHDRRGELRITVRSPSGTYSILQRSNNDLSPGPDDWTYWSVQHFREPTRGTWTVAVTDATPNTVGTLAEVELTLRGVPITDSDNDGLDDSWEKRWFGDLTPEAAGDPDQDGSVNAREFILGTPPTSRPSLVLDASAFDTKRLRLSWPASPHFDYEITAADGLGADATPVATVPGTFPEGEWITRFPASGAAFYRVVERAR